MMSRIKRLSFSVLFFLFFFGSIIGFILEGLWCVLKRGHWENHSATVIGPLCIIYGLGLVAFYLLSLFINGKNPLIQFLLSGIVGSTLEFFASLFQELLFGSTSWDYSGHAFNLGGRISLKMTVIWGLLGLAFVRLLFPFKQTRIIRTCLKGHNFGAFRFVVAYKRQLYKFLRAKNPSKFCTF